MTKVVIDENLPRSFGEIFTSHNHEVFDIRDYRLRGAPDSTIFNFAKENNAAVVTSDLNFAQRIHRSEEEHQGVFLIRLPSFLSVELRCKLLNQALEKLGGRELPNKIIVITPTALRIHQKGL